MYALFHNLRCDTDLYSASVNTMLYEISCYIGPLYDNTQLYVLKQATMQNIDRISDSPLLVSN